MARLFRMAQQDGEFTSLSLTERKPARSGAQSPPLPQDATGSVLGEPPATRGNSAPFTMRWTGSVEGASLSTLPSHRVTILYLTVFTASNCLPPDPRHQTGCQQADHLPYKCPPGPGKARQRYLHLLDPRPHQLRRPLGPRERGSGQACSSGVCGPPPHDAIPTYGSCLTALCLSCSSLLPASTAASD